MRRSLKSKIKSYLIKSTRQSFSNEQSNKPKDLKYIFTFGKHQGETLESVLDTDPSYIVWANDTIKWFKVTKKIYDKAKEESTRHAYYYYYDEDFMWSGIDPYDFCD